ncbi:FtsW/RodA/SpoVE family cell cycle protein [Candidatus Saccharibacteria bacterium]|nr:FtsW/RodA/SpoVE family cell cycle protein [Candidatus Saccharibacteria bacterium]MCL1962802.1 FtsW/RodA/SpoVE family cell cycle protein [Candidatus Saccharibacteria bacterium]
MSRRSNDVGRSEPFLHNLAKVFKVGPKLDLGRKHRPDYILVVLIAILSVIGLVTLFSIAPAVTAGDGMNEFMWRQGMFLVASILAFVIASRIPLDFWRRFGVMIFMIALIMCLLLPIMGWLKIPPAFCTKGACRWYNFGSFGFQPAEFLKFGMILLTSGFLAVRVALGEINSWQKTLLPACAMLMISLFVIVIMQKDLGTGVALVAIFLMQLVIAGVEWSNLLWIVSCIVVLGVGSILIAPHRLARMSTFMGQGNDTADYHIDQAMIALGSGGFSGRGLGQSVQSFGYLPEAIHDSIFAIVGEIFGFIGLVVLLLIFAALLKRIIDKIDFTENVYLRLVAAGVFGWLAAHIIMNIGAMIQILPLTGITLPLVSFGGTSMLFIMASLGLVFAISHYTIHRKVSEVKGVSYADSLGGRRVGRSYYANRSGR